MSAPEHIDAFLRDVYRALFSGDPGRVRPLALEPEGVLPSLGRIEPDVLERYIQSMQVSVSSENDGRIWVMAAFAGTMMFMPLAETPEGLRLDARWLASLGREPDEDEMTARTFLFAMIAGDTDLLGRTSMSDPRLGVLVSRPAPAGELGVYEDACRNLPMARLRPGETYSSFEGGRPAVRTVQPEQDTPEHRVWAMYFERSLLSFEVRKFPAGWRVDPRPMIEAAMAG